MKHIENWDDIQEQQPGEFELPAPGGYIARIVNVDDVENKEYLRIKWEFEEGQYKGSNAETYNRAGFWPIVLIRSYKPKALGFFKAFKTSVEMSNKGYAFDDRRPGELAGKLMGVVLGEEEYIKGDGSAGKRLYVYQVRSVKAVRNNDFEVPKLKRLKQDGRPPASYGQDEQFQRVEPLSDDDCPF